MPLNQQPPSSIQPVDRSGVIVRRLLWLVIPLIAGLLFSAAAHILSNRNVNLVGGCPPSSDHYLDGQPAPPGAAITYCSKGDGDRILLSSSWMASGTRRIDIQTAGYGAAQSQTLHLEARDGRSTLIPLPGLGERWTRQTIIVPSDMTNQPVRLILNDEAGTFRSWSGLDVTSYSPVTANLQVIAELIWILGGLHFAVAELALMLSRALPKDQAVVASIAGLGLASWATFWASYTFGSTGALIGAAIGVILLVHLIASLLRSDVVITENFLYVNRLFLPISSSVLVVFVASLYPFPHGWDTWQYAADRWRSLPMDIWLPKYFADQLWAGHVNHPMIGDWLSSDRPPLQTGFYLMFKPLAVSSGALYLIPAMWLQATCILPMFYIVRGLGCRLSPAPIIMLLSVSALFLYNDAFVWPKLIAATFCAVTYLALLSNGEAVGGWISKAVISGLGAALAMLSHGGAAFALFGIFAIYLFQRDRNTWRILALAAATALITYLPWSLYQKLVDPPGTRLIAWQLAGVHPVSTQPISWVLQHAYAQLTPAQWLHNRAANVATIMHGTTGFFTDFMALFGRHAHQARADIVVNSFFYTTYSQWFFSPLLAVILLVVARRRLAGLRPMLRQPVAVLLVGLAFWAIVLFEPGATVIHQGAYFLDLLGLLIVGVMTLAASARFFYLLLGLNVFVVLDVFILAGRITASAVPPVPVEMQSLYWIPSHDHVYLLLVIAAIVLNFVVVWKSYHVEGAIEYRGKPHPIQIA